MKDTEKKMIFILLIILVIIFIAFMIIKGKSKKSEEKNIGEEYVNVQQDGTKVNTSTKLAESKMIDGLQISSISLTEKDNQSYITGIVENTTEEVKGDEFITLTIIDKDENILTTVKAYLDTVQPGDAVRLSVKTSCDFANAYDFRLSK